MGVIGVSHDGVGGIHRTQTVVDSSSLVRFCCSFHISRTSVPYITDSVILKICCSLL